MFRYEHVAKYSILLALNIICGLSVIADIVVVQNNSPNADIMIDSAASSDVSGAADTLAEYIEKSTGAELSVLTSGGIKPIKIHVGASTYVNGLSLNLTTLTRDGFVIAFPDSSNIVIVGRTDIGTEFGVYEFLERYVGVRWLMPGDIGAYVPESSSLSVPVAEVRQSPVFQTRNLFGMQNTTQSTWARRNRMYTGIKYHHYLRYVFPVSIYGPNGTDPHVEFYPVIDDERYIPEDASDYDWQPSFNATGIVNTAVSYYNSYITQNSVTSFSLGVNDSVNFNEDEWTGNYNYLGYKDYSDVYYAWANSVITGVLQTHPDVEAGCLAYMNVTSPPSFNVHPKLTPFICSDRMKWCDSTIESSEKNINSQWEAKATSLGWYDYIHGAAYLLPRVYMHHMSDYYYYGMNHEVKHMTSEAYPFWGEGPKLYVSLKLQWDPTLDVDDLLDEWYSLAVGGDPDTAGTAAYYLKQYYEHWEDFWTTRAILSDWFSDGVYLSFNSRAYLDIVARSEIEQSRAWLEAAVANAGTPEQQARAGLLLKAFEYYEASAISYFIHRSDLTDVDDALDRLNDIDAYVCKKDWLDEVYESYPTLEKTSSTKVKNCPLFQNHMMEWTANSSTLLQRVQDMALRSKWSTLRRDAGAMLDLIDGKYDTLTLLAPSFETSGAWTAWSGSGATMTRTSADSHTGNYSYLFTSGGFGSMGGIYQNVTNLQSGRYALSCWVKGTGTMGAGHVDAGASLLDSSGNVIPGSGFSAYQYILQPDEWTHIWFIVDVPDEFGGYAVGGMRLSPTNCFAFDEDAEVYIDDVCLYELTGVSVAEQDRLKLYMPLDEGDGAGIDDTSLYGNDGVLYNVDMNSCWKKGKVGSAVEFDGVNDYIDCGSDSSLDITGDITVEAWLKPSSGQISYATPISKNGVYKIMLNNNTVYCGSLSSIGYGTTFTYADNQWIHVAWTYSTTTGKIITYKNGVPQGTVSSSGNLQSTTKALRIGTEQDTNRPYKGLIDEVRVYSRALTAEEVKSHYQDSIITGKWDFEESDALDYTANSNNGNPVNMDSQNCWVAGKLGDAVAFDGVDDYLDCGNDKSLDITEEITVEAWLKPSSNQVSYATPVSKYGAYKIMLNNNTVYCGSFSGIGYGTTFTYVDDEWIHVAWTFSTTTGEITTYKNGVKQTPVSTGSSIPSSSYSLRIGAEHSTGRHYKGLIDQVRIYNQSLSEDEIIAHYREGFVAGKWSFEDADALDYSGNNNNGTLCYMDIQNCWDSGVSGDAIEFDGSNDYVNCGNDSSLNITGDITVEAWLKPSSTQPGYATPVSKYGAYKIMLSNNTVYCGNISSIGYGTTFTYTNDQWIYVAWTYCAATGEIITYKNGVQQASVYSGGSLPSTTSSLWIGGEQTTGRMYKGLVDEVRVHNRVLSPGEISAQYQQYQ